MSTPGGSGELLVVFDVLMQERCASRSAARLGMSWADLDQALARLRAALEDDLFTGCGPALQPTALARRIAAARARGDGSLPRLLSLYRTISE